MKRRWHTIGLGVFLLLAAAIWTGCSETKETAGTTFYEVIQTEKSQVTGISVEYLGVTVSLQEDAVDRILSSFESAAFVEKLQEDPFTESEYVLIIETADSSCTYPICWFTGKALDENGKIAGYADRRFDVYADGSWYVFQQDSETYWNEDCMEIHFNRAAQKAGITIPTRYIMDGYDGEIQRIEDRYSNDPVTSATAESIVQEADILILATFIDSEYHMTYSSHHQDRVSRVQVEEVLKGENIPATILVQGEGTTVWEMKSDGRRCVLYPDRENPDFKEDTLYLLCLCEADQTEVYRLYDSVQGSAVVQDGITYPRYNTEYHPFYRQNLEELLSRIDS